MRINILIIAVFLVIAGCSTSRIDVVGRYASDDKRTFLILLPDGQVEIEDVGPPQVVFSIGRWKSKANGVVEIQSIGDKLRLRSARVKGRDTFKVTNPLECPDMIATWKIGDSYKLIRTSKP